MRRHCILRCLAVQLFGIVWVSGSVYKGIMYRTFTPELFWSNTSVVVFPFSFEVLTRWQRIRKGVTSKQNRKMKKIPLSHRLLRFLPFLPCYVFFCFFCSTIAFECSPLLFVNPVFLFRSIFQHCIGSFVFRFTFYLGAVHGSHQGSSSSCAR